MNSKKFLAFVAAILILIVTLTSCASSVTNGGTPIEFQTSYYVQLSSGCGGPYRSFHVVTYEGCQEPSGTVNCVFSPAVIVFDKMSRDFTDIAKSYRIEGGANCSMHIVEVTRTWSIYPSDPGYETILEMQKVPTPTP